LNYARAPSSACRRGSARASASIFNGTLTTAVLLNYWYLLGTTRVYTSVFSQHVPHREKYPRSRERLNFICSATRHFLEFLRRLIKSYRTGWDAMYKLYVQISSLWHFYAHNYCHQSGLSHIWNLKMCSICHMSAHICTDSCY